MSNIIRSANPSGFLAVSPAGHLVAVPSRAAREAKTAAKSGPLKGA